MSLPEYNTPNCQAWEEHWDNFEDAERFICPVCDKLWPNTAIYYPGLGGRPICKEHKEVHRVYKILDAFEQEVFGDQFNAMTVTLKLSEEGII